MSLPNLEHFNEWQFFMKDIASPQSFVDFGYWSMIGMSLERRVWIGDVLNPLYLNTNVVLVGPSAVGKGQVINPIYEMLNHHKLPQYVNHNKPAQNAESQKVDPNQEVEVEIGEYNLRGESGHKKPEEEKLLFPMAPDASTYESLVEDLAKSIRHINYPVWNEKLNKMVNGIYMHSSMGACLEELSSLFQHNTENLVNFLVKTYDCKQYKKKTKTGGLETIRACCISILGGTQPSFIQKVFNSDLLNEGFASRTWFVYEYAPRHRKLQQATFTPEQLKARQNILDHMKKLSLLYGRVHFSKDAWAYLEHMWEVELLKKRPNMSPRLDPYYGRWGIHAQKMAGIIHFSETTDIKKEIGLDTCQYAVKCLEYIERKMHFALTFGEKNPLSATAKKITKHLGQIESATFNQLFLEFVDDVRESELREIMQFLQGTEQVGNITKNGDLHYMLLKKQINGSSVHSKLQPEIDITTK